MVENLSVNSLKESGRRHNFTVIMARRLQSKLILHHISQQMLNRLQPNFVSNIISIFLYYGAKMENIGV